MNKKYTFLIALLIAVGTVPFFMHAMEVAEPPLNEDQQPITESNVESKLILIFFFNSNESEEDKCAKLQSIVNQLSQSYQDISQELALDKAWKRLFFILCTDKHFLNYAIKEGYYKIIIFLLKKGILKNCPTMFSDLTSVCSKKSPLCTLLLKVNTIQKALNTNFSSREEFISAWETINRELKQSDSKMTRELMGVQYSQDHNMGCCMPFLPLMVHLEALITPGEKTILTTLLSYKPNTEDIDTMDRHIQGNLEWIAETDQTLEEHRQILDEKISETKQTIRHLKDVQPFIQKYKNKEDSHNDSNSPSSPPPSSFLSSKILLPTVAIIIATTAFINKKKIKAWWQKTFGPKPIPTPATSQQPLSENTSSLQDTEVDMLEIEPTTA